MFEAKAMCHVTGPFTIIDDNFSLILKKCLLKSKPHPLDNLKSTRICDPIPKTLAFNTSGAPLLSTVVTVI